MKKLYLLLLFCIATFQSLTAQFTCESAEPFCGGSSGLSFPAVVNGSFAEPGIDYNCLFTQPNPYWFDFMIGAAGSLDFQISNVSGSNIPIDVDYILWGPFPNAVCGAANLNASTEINCSYSTAGVENFTISNAQPGQHYKILITNFGNQAGTITIQQTNLGAPGAGTSTCNIVCPISISGSGAYICEQGAAYLTAYPDYPGATYQWSSSVSGSLPNSGPILMVTEAGNYTVNVTIPGCLTASATASVYNYILDNQDANDLYACSNQPSTNFDLTVNETTVMTGLNTSDYIFMGFYHSSIDAYQETNVISNPANYNGVDGEILYYSIVDENSGCYKIRSFTLNIDNNTPTVTVDVSDQTITVNTTPPGDYMYTIDDNDATASNVFTEVELGEHIISVISACGIVSQTATVEIPNAPFGTSPQYYVDGQTLADLVMNGQNIQWYDAASRTMMPTPLPLSTLLVNNTTYYATQTINGVESVNRFPVLVLALLANPEHAFSGLSYYPNPVKNRLFISNAMPIDKVTIYSVLGQDILAAKPNGLEANIDVSHFANGTYFAEIQCSGARKVIRFIKD